ncbi:hypothetical protein BH23ACT12_BH23ACT12_24490 [soil metagenome]
MVNNKPDVPAGSAPEAAGTHIPAPRKPDRKRLLVVLAVVVVAALVLFLANRDDNAPDGEEAASAEPVPIEDREAGYSLELPQNWQFFEQQQEDPQIRMVAGEPGTQNNLRVRAVPLPQPVVIDDNTAENVIAELQAQFDKYIDDGENVREVIQRQRVRINGIQGWWYLYSFNDSAGQEDGIHSHFFMLGGNKMYILVFQVLPASNYANYAGTFDDIIASFKLIEPVAAPAPSPAG